MEFDFRSISFDGETHVCGRLILSLHARSSSGLLCIIAIFATASIRSLPFPCIWCLFDTFPVG